MQCTSFVHVYYDHPRGLNGAGGFSWHLMNANVNYGDQRCFNNSLPLSTLDQHVSYDKDVWRQIIQNHEATFRYQVQELHRLYQRQRELTKDMRMRGMAAHQLISQTSESIHCMSYPYSDISQTSRAPTWPLRDHKWPELIENIQQCPSFAVENFPEQTTIQNLGTLMGQNGCNEIKLLPSICEGNGKRILNLQLPVDEQGKQFKAPEVMCSAPKKHSDGQPASGSVTDSVKTGYMCNYTSNGRKTDCLIDLNEPIQLESLSSNSISPFETCTRHNDPCVSGETTPESLVPKQSIVLNCINLPMAIDLNSVPENCFLETETTEIINEGITAVQDSTLVDDYSTRKERCDEDATFTNTIIDDKLKMMACIDLNSGTVVAEHSPLQSNTTKDEIDSPQRNSGNIQLETSVLSERGDEESRLERDIIAAETLVAISSGNSLYWFSEVVSSIGDDVENEIKRLQNNETGSDQGKYQVVGALSSRSTKRRARQDNEFPEISTHRRNSRKKACAKIRKCSKLVPSDAAKKSMSPILKQHATRSRQSVLQSWGMIRKRQGGDRRRASKFVIIN